MMVEIDRAIRATLLHLEKILREGGDNVSADKTIRILESPYRISALHQTFASNLKKTSRTDSTSHERRLWFEDFSSRHGNCLKEKQLHKLTSITKHWALSEEKVDSLASCSLLWSSCPTLFWEGKNTNSDMIRRCFDDLERIREIQPLRRKTILTILSEYVDAEVEQMRKSGKRQRHRYPPNADAPCASRGKMLLPTSLRSIVRRLWPEAHPEEQKKLKQRLSLYSRYGWKWQQVQPRGMILSLPDCAAKRFETAAWTSIEFEAINQFIKTLPQYRIQTLLRRTLGSLVSFYNGKVQLETSSAIPAYSISTEGTSVDRQSPILRQLHSDAPTNISQPGETRMSASDVSSSSVIPARDLTPPVSEPVSQSEQTARLRERATTEPPDNLDAQEMHATLISSTTISPIRCDVKESLLGRGTIQTSSDSQLRNSLLPRISEAKLANDAGAGLGMDSFDISQVSRNEFPPGEQSDMSMPQARVLPSQAQEDMNETALYGHRFNDTDLAMQGLFNRLSNLPASEASDNSFALQWNASDAEHHVQTIDLASANGVDATNESHPVDHVLANDTNLALFAIEPQAETDLFFPSFNDTSLTMSAFAPEFLDHDQGKFGINSS